MRYWLDTEFIDDGRAIDLISIGIVCEDGRELYLQSVEFNIDRASPWVRENVLMHLGLCPWVMAQPPYSLGTIYGAQAQHKTGQCTFSDPAKGIIGAHANCPWRTRKQLLHEVDRFFRPSGEYEEFELWGWCAGYDFVALCQLYGTMMDVPFNYPHYIRDIQYLLDERGIADDVLPKPEGQAHNALSDARQIQAIWKYLQQ
jgi:hypothetical protein